MDLKKIKIVFVNIRIENLIKILILCVICMYLFVEKKLSLCMLILNVVIENLN